MNKILKLISSVLIALLATLSISKAEVKVVASIKPIHSWLVTLWMVLVNLM